MASVIDTLGVRRDVWAAKLGNDLSKIDQAEREINALLDDIRTPAVKALLAKRGVVLDDLSSGSFIVAELGSGNQGLGIILSEIQKFRSYRVWFGDHNPSNKVVAESILLIVGDYLAPIAPDGKTVMPKGKLLHAKIHEQLLQSQEAT